MKKKLQTRFPATRIKKIMQTDEEVGKIAMAVPLLVSKALELFLQDLCNHTYDITLSRGAKTVSSFHLKQCVHAFNVFDFLRDTVGKVPDLCGSDAEDQSATKRRKLVDESNCNEEDMKNTQVNEVKHSGSGRGKQGKGRGRGGGKTGSGLSLTFEEDGSPESSRTPSPENRDTSWKKVHSNVRNFDLNVDLDENGDTATWLEKQLEESPEWPSLGMNEMKIDPDQQQQQQQASASDEEDYDEESIE
ncbi:PREDICTED: dr1-associated corepressor-like isoform X1 [Camelina sativa]|uniref:Dr1-associated corepressor-like isoform X1 n=1 Tax=Camelina sativa TaxID=90675 RepID=A0ABM0VCP7_CAMSA|nr:PREDICTED: dr1-associated corepressor-like isoform X1 [Camelina sativa]